MKFSLVFLGLLAYHDGATLGSTHHSLPVKNAGVRRTLGKGGKGKGGSTADDGTLPPTEEIFEQDGSNDSSHLEHICGLFSEFGSQTSNFQESCDDFDRFKYLMCPDEYEIGKICDFRTQYQAIQDAITGEYCGPLFSALSDVPVEQDLCVDLCNSFVAESDCCELSCPN